MIHNRLQIEITYYPDSLLFISAAELILLMTTKLYEDDRTLLLLLQMSGDVHPNPGLATKYPCPVCARNVTSRRVSYQCNRYSRWCMQKCSGLLNAAQYLRSSDWACDPVRHQHLHHLLPILHLQIKKVMTARSTAQCKWNW